MMTIKTKTGGIYAILPRGRKEIKRYKLEVQKNCLHQGAETHVFRMYFA